MPLRHALILAINTSLLAVLFTFTTWLYRDSRAEVERSVASSLERSKTITGHLARLREAELSSLAQNLAASPMLQGALATGDRETIEDVLSSLAAKNKLAWAGLARDGALRHLSPSPHGVKDPATLERGLFLGRAETGRSDLLLILAEKPSRELLEAWSQITSVRYALGARAGAEPICNLPAADLGLLTAKRGLDSPSVISAAGRYYARRALALDGRLEAVLFAPYDPFWSDFKTRRNSLIVLGGVLFFGGLCMSILFAGLIERHAAQAGSKSASEDWPRLLAEIEAARARRP